MTIKKFVNDNYQVTKIVGIGSNASAIVLKESEINDEVRKASKSEKYFVFKDWNMIERSIDGENLKAYIDQLSA